AQGIARKIQVVVVAQPGDVARRRTLLDWNVLAVDVLDEVHGGVPKHRGHRGRRVVLLLALVAVAPVGLLSEHQLRRVGRHELPLLRRRVARGACRECERGGRGEDEARDRPSESAQHGATLTRAQGPGHTVFPRLLAVDDRDRAAAPPGLELHDAGSLGEDRVVAADADSVAGAEAGAALAHDDLAAVHGLPGEHLDPEHLRIGVTAVPARSEPLLMSHRSAPSWPRASSYRTMREASAPASSRP